jgi:tetratricopeptide (TPR) repeat protein
MVQFVLGANALYLAIQSLVLALIAAGIVIVIVNGDRLRHGLFERLVPFISADTARWWAWLILAAPYLAGIGPALPTLVFLGMLWPSARLRERSLFVTLTLVLAGMPLLTATLDRVSSPLHEDRAPFYGVPQLQTEPDSPELLASVEARAAAHPDNAFLAFAAGWLAQRHGDAAASEAHYRAELLLRPDDDRALNNLGNALAAQGRSAEALDCYTRATQIQPRNAAAHFNASQIHTLDYDFHLANEELAKATALDFELVKTYQAERAEAKWTALVDQWISTRDFWRAMRRAPFSTGAVGALPPLWRGRIECSGWAFSLIALAVAIAALGLGLWMNRAIPVRGCGNCGTPVCRRCAERKRTLALCSTCAMIESRSKSPEFGRVLLGQHRRRLQQRRAALYRVLGVLVPGLGYLPYRKLIRPIVAFAVLAALVCLSIGLATPFSYEPRFAVPGHDVPLLALGAAWLAFYLIATPTYLAFEQVARERARTLGAGPRPRPARPAATPDRAAA